MTVQQPLFSFGSKPWVCLGICLPYIPSSCGIVSSIHRFQGWSMKCQPNPIRISHLPGHTEVSLWLTLCDSSDTLLLQVFSWSHEEVFFISSWLKLERWKTKAASAILLPPGRAYLWLEPRLRAWSSGGGRTQSLVSLLEPLYQAVPGTQQCLLDFPVSWATELLFFPPFFLYVLGLKVGFVCFCNANVLTDTLVDFQSSSYLFGVWMCFLNPDIRTVT